MPVLGKRTRRSLEDEEVARPKRKAPTQRNFVIVSDDEEEEDPFTTPRKSKRQRTGKPIYVDDLDELAVENTPPTKVDDTRKGLASNPTTPRHRDNLAKKIAITPRHRVALLSSRPQTPQTLRSPTTPRAHYPSVYNEARKLFKATVQ
jgi:cell division control protein 6